MTAFTDFIDLQTAVIEAVQRPDIADVMPRLVKMAEVGFNRRLRTRRQMASGALTVSGGSAALPDDFLQVIALIDGSGQEHIAQPILAVGQPYQRGYFAIDGSTLRAHDEAYTLRYYAGIPTLTTSLTTSNWLLQAAPGLYLYGVALEAAKYIRDVESAQGFAAVLEGEYRDIASQDAAERYSRARVRVQGPTP